MKTGFRLFIFLLAAAAASACVVPTHLADENPYGSQSIGFVVLHETSRSEVSAALGAPAREFSDGRWWLYQSDRRMTAWFWFIATPGGADGGEFGGDVRIYSLIIEFSDDDVVGNLTVVTDQKPCADDKAVCYVDGRLTVVQESTTVARTYRDKSANATATDRQLQALRGEETDRFSATLDSGKQVEIIERGGLFFDAGSMQPFTGHITMFDDASVRRAERTYDRGKLEGAETMWYPSGEKTIEAHYKDNLLHGPFLVWERDGSISGYACYENGELATLETEICPR